MQILPYPFYVNTKTATLKHVKICASNFKTLIEQTNVKQVIFLSGISNANDLSKHLAFKKNVETLLSGSNFALTTLNVTTRRSMA
jgi:hypothetical protein